MSRTPMAFASLSVLAALSAASAVRAVTLNQSYYSVQYSTSSTFAAGTTTTVTVGPAAPTLAIPAGDYFRFGIAAYVTNNPDPASGTAYDRANQTENGVDPLPATLGLAAFGYSVFSADVTGSTVTPLRTTTTGSAADASTAKLDPAFTFAASQAGDVTGGDVGVTNPIAAGNVPPFPETARGVAELGQFTAANSYAFRYLTYQTSPTLNAAATLTPTLVPADTAYFSITSPGTVDAQGNIATDPTIVDSPFTAAGDSLGTLPPLSLVTFGAVPEPASVTLVLGGVLLGRHRRRSPSATTAARGSVRRPGRT